MGAAVNSAHGKLKWIDNVAGDYRITARKRGGVILWVREIWHSDWPTAKLARMFAERHLAAELQATGLGK